MMRTVMVRSLLVCKLISILLLTATAEEGRCSQWRRKSLLSPIKLLESPSSTIRTSSTPLSNNGALIHCLGGGSDTQSLADYSGDAQTLFSNVIAPSAMIAGSLVPLGFLAPPLPSGTKLEKRLNALYSLLAVLSLCNQIMAIIYATVASNKLVEVASVPAMSVFALIQRDYELAWIATNVHFLFGLFGFLCMIGLRAGMTFPSHLQGPAAGLCLSALLACASIVNRGVSKGDGLGHEFGSSIVTLVARYFTLLLDRKQEGSVLIGWCAMAAGMLSVVYAGRAVLYPE